MKQHVMQQDIDILSSELKKKVFNQFNNPLLSIGEMIAFIKEWGGDKVIIGIYEQRTRWDVALYKRPEEGGELGESSYFGKEKELCDSLWKTILKILE